MVHDGKIARLEPASQYAADKSYFATTARLCEGLERTVEGYQDSQDPRRTRIHELWTASRENKAG